MSRAARQARRLQQKDKSHGHKGLCFYEQKLANGTVEICARRGPAKMECEVCLKKGVAKPFALQTCADHAFTAREQLKKHLLTKHPSVLPSWMIAALSGEDMR